MDLGKLAAAKRLIFFIQYASPEPAERAAMETFDGFRVVARNGSAFDEATDTIEDCDACAGRAPAAYRRRVPYWNGTAWEMPDVPEAPRKRQKTVAPPEPPVTPDDASRPPATPLQTAGPALNPGTIAAGVSPVAPVAPVVPKA